MIDVNVFSFLFFQAHVMRQRQQYEKLCRQMDDIKEEMKTRVRMTSLRWLCTLYII